MSSNDIYTEATGIITQFPVYKVRKDMSSQEYTSYKLDWETFNMIWTYDYTIKTLNKNASVYGPLSASAIIPPYEYKSQGEVISYIRGLESHVSAYPSSTILFTTIPINLSTFNSLSTIYGQEQAATASTIAGLSTVAGDLVVFNHNLSTLGLFSTIDSFSTLNADQTSTLSSIISPADRSTFYFLDGETYLSSVLNGPIPSTIEPIGYSTVAIYISSYVLDLTPPPTFYSYLASSIVSTTQGNLSILASLSSLDGYNEIYSYFPPPNVSTYSSLSTLESLNVKYSYFSPAQQSTLFSLSNTFLYPESRLSTYVSLSSLASYSTIYQPLPSSCTSTLNSLSTIASLSTFYPALSPSNTSSLFGLSTTLSFYEYMSTGAIQLGSNDLSTFYTLSSYSYFLPPM